jgi:hypothetical protein
VKLPVPFSYYLCFCIAVCAPVGWVSLLLPLRLEPIAGSKFSNSIINQIFKCSQKQLETSTTSPIRLQDLGFLWDKNGSIAVVKGIDIKNK